MKTKMGLPLITDVSLGLFSVKGKLTVRDREKPRKERIIRIEEINETQYGETLIAILMGNNIVFD